MTAGEGRLSAAGMSQEEGDRIAAAVLHLMQTLASGRPAPAPKPLSWHREVAEKEGWL